MPGAMQQTMPPAMPPTQPPGVIAPSTSTQPQATDLFLKCYNGVIEKRLPQLNPNIFRTQPGADGPLSARHSDKFKNQVIPSAAYRA